MAQGEILEVQNLDMRHYISTFHAIPLNPPSLDKIEDRFIVITKGSSPLKGMRFTITRVDASSTSATPAP